MINTLVILFFKDIENNIIEFINNFTKKEFIIENNYIKLNDVNFDILFSLHQILEYEFGLKIISFYFKNKNNKSINDTDVYLKLIDMNIIKENFVHCDEYSFEKFILESDVVKIIEDFNLRDFELTDFDIKFIIDFYRNEANVAKFSRNEFMHRNSVLYHIDRIQRKSGLNLKVYKDVLKLYIFSILKKIDK